MPWYVDFLAVCILLLPFITLWSRKHIDDTIDDESDDSERLERLELLQREVDALYYERDLLQELSYRHDLGRDYKQASTKNIKTALTLEKQLHAINKKIEKIESQLESLEE